MIAIKAIRSLLWHGDVERLPAGERKSLGSFNFGNSGWILPPQMADRALSCLVDQTNISSLMGQAVISVGSIIFCRSIMSISPTVSVGRARPIARSTMRRRISPGLVNSKLKPKQLGAGLCWLGDARRCFVQRGTVGDAKGQSRVHVEDLERNYLRNWSGGFCLCTDIFVCWLLARHLGRAVEGRHNVRRAIAGRPSCATMWSGCCHERARGADHRPFSRCLVILRHDHRLFVSSAVIDLCFSEGYI